MKRGGRPKRTKGLHVDPEKVREFMARGRGKLTRRTQLDRTGPPKRKTPQRPKEGPLTPLAWRREGIRLSRGRSVVSGARVKDAENDPRCHHHPIPKQELRRRGLHHLVWHPHNHVLVTPDEHANHEVASHRIPYERLPERVKRFARQLGPWAEDKLLRLHPAAGTRGDPTTGGPDGQG